MTVIEISDSGQITKLADPASSSQTNQTRRKGRSRTTETETTNTLPVVAPSLFPALLPSDGSPYSTSNAASSRRTDGAFQKSETAGGQNTPTDRNGQNGRSNRTTPQISSPRQDNIGNSDKNSTLEKIGNDEKNTADPKNARAPREPREPRQPRTPRPPRESRESREAREQSPITGKAHAPKAQNDTPPQGDDPLKEGEPAKRRRARRGGRGRKRGTGSAPGLATENAIESSGQATLSGVAELSENLEPLGMAGPSGVGEPLKMADPAAMIESSATLMAASHTATAEIAEALSTKSRPGLPVPAFEAEESQTPKKPRSRSRRKPAPASPDAEMPDTGVNDTGVNDTGDDTGDDTGAIDSTVHNTESTSDESAAPSSKLKAPKPPRGRGKKTGAVKSPEKVWEKNRKPSAELDEDLADLDDDADDADLDEDAAPRKASDVDRKMLVSVLPGDLVEVVITEQNKVHEYYVEMVHQAKIRGNIYKGVINNIDTNLQAAFVNYGNVKNGFLQIDEVHPEYWLTHHDPLKGHKYPPIQKVMKPGQEVLVQVVKEPTGNKGAFLTTWVSLAGRFLVLTPGQEQIGISRKVEDGEERNRLRELIKGLEPGPGLGAIVRTVSVGTSKTTLQKDLSFLKRVWKDIRKRATTEKAPSLIYEEPGLASRAVRDYLSDDVSEIWVDDEETAEGIREMATLLFPRKADLVHLYTEKAKSLWERFDISKQLDQVHSREVTMPSGGRLVFDQTEALMAIDINSGKIGGKTNFASMAHRTNMEAAESIARQLRLRDIGGQIVIDFIEMRDQNHCRDVEKALRTAMKGDRARHDIGKMSAFGLLQIVRQRIGSSAISNTLEPCPHCNGTGVRRNMEWQALQLLRDLHRHMAAAAATGLTQYTHAIEAECAMYLLNHKRDNLSALEKTFGVRLDIQITGLSS